MCELFWHPSVESKRFCRLGQYNLQTKHYEAHKYQLWRTSMLIRIMSTGRCLVFSNIFKNSEVSVFFPLGRPNIMGFMKIDISTHDAVFEKCVMMMYINAGSVGNISCFGSLPHKLPVVLASWRKAFLNSIGMQLKETRDLKNVVFGFCLCRILALSSTKSNSLPSLPVPHL